MTGALIHDPGARVRELADQIAAATTAPALLAIGDQIADAINAEIVMLPVPHFDEVADHDE